MFLPKFYMKDISVGSGFIIGRNNVEDFSNHVNGIYDLIEKPLVDLAHNYETTIAYLVGMTKVRFVNFNPILQQIFLKLDSMEKGGDKDFVLRTLLMYGV